MIRREYPDPLRRRHAVIRYQHHVDPVAEGQRRNPVQNPSERRVDCRYRALDVGILRTIPVSRVVDVAHVNCDKVRPLSGRHRQPCDGRIGSLIVRGGIRECLRASRPDSFDRRLTSHPEVRRGHHSLLFSGDPDRLTAIPRPVEHFLVVADCVGRVTRRIVEPVGDDSMRLRIISGYDRVVIWKSLGGKRRDEPHCANALTSDSLKIGSVVFVEVVAAKPVERHEDDVRLVELVGAVDSARAGARSGER